MNSNVGTKHPIDYLSDGTGNLTIQDIYVNNVTLDSDTKIIKTQSASSFYMRNCTFIETHPKEIGDSTVKLIGLSSIVLTDMQNLTIEDTYIEQSTVGFVELVGIQSTDPLLSYFVISNFIYKNSFFEFSEDLIWMRNIETVNEFRVMLTDINMNNITFFRTGNLLKFGHQTNTSLVFSDSMFQDLYGAQIYIQSSNLQNTNLKTKIEMTNITASSIHGSSKSFILIEEGGELMISDSRFINIDNTEQGSVLNAGYQNGYVEVHNSTFENNLSIYGGVANVQDGSVIKFYDSNITENFAIQSGAIQASSDGRFELYR